MASTNHFRLLMVIAAMVVLAIVYSVLTMPDQRTPVERMGDAMVELPDNPKGAARQLQKRTPGEKLEDAIEDAGEEVKRTTDNE